MSTIHISAQTSILKCLWPKCPLLKCPSLNCPCSIGRSNVCSSNVLSLKCPLSHCPLLKSPLPICSLLKCPRSNGHSNVHLQMSLAQMSLAYKVSVPQMFITHMSIAQMTFTHMSVAQLSYCLNVHSSNVCHPNVCAQWLFIKCSNASGSKPPSIMIFDCNILTYLW